MKSIITGSRAVAEAVKRVSPNVIAAYPITPQTHITENLAQMVASGELKSEYIRVESEFGAISCCIGASATGVRSFTATSSQGLALMHEALFATSGMRLPIVMAVANRALSAPINIWNDIQDSISQRDVGWLQLYCETNQEVFDTMIQAFTVSENKDVLLPSMVCLDGFYLTHTVEPVDTLPKEEVLSFVGEYKPTHAYLDTKRPITQGPFAYPEYYMRLRRQQEDAIQTAKKVIVKEDERFGKAFGRSYPLLEKTGDDADCILTLGSLTGNCRIIAEQEKCSLIKLKCFRPFPLEELKKAVKGIERLIIIEKDVSIGLGTGVVASEIKDALYGMKDRPKVYGFIAGLGGVDVKVSDVKEILEKVRSGRAKPVEWWL